MWASASSVGAQTETMFIRYGDDRWLTAVASSGTCATAPSMWLMWNWVSGEVIRPHQETIVSMASSLGSCSHSPPQ